MAFDVHKYQQSAIRLATEGFLRDVDSLKDGLPIAMIAIQSHHRHVHEVADKFEVAHCKRIIKDGKHFMEVPFEYTGKYETIRRELSKSHSAYGIVERSFLVSLVSQYDAFIGRLLRALIAFRPDILSKGNEESEDVGSRQDKALSYSELLKFSSIEDAKEHVISETIENLLRKSHKDQFIWLERRFDLPLRKDLPIWPKFIEITQRRHLFVHADGVVSRQYLKKCQEEGVSLPTDAKAGTLLHMDQAYFEGAREVFYEIAFKLSQVLWRKVAPKQIEFADIYLNNVAYGLIESKDYNLAKTLLNFACQTLKKHESDKAERMLIFNRALAYKLSGSVKEAKQIITEHDWTATGDLFALAIAALEDETPKVIQMMKRLGRNSPDIDMRSYREWPLFSEFRVQPEFQAAFKSIFRKPLIPANVDYEPQIEPAMAEGDNTRITTKRKHRSPVAKPPTVH